MASEDETIADIIAEMRRREKSHYYPKVARNIMHQYSNRFDAAWKRKKVEIEANALACGGIVEASRHTPGNAAVMRESLRALRDASRDFYNQILNSKYSEILDKYTCVKQGFPAVLDLRSAFPMANHALSAPARNCDRPECATSKDAQNVWRKEDGGKTPYYEWLLAPAAERKGECDDA